MIDAPTEEELVIKARAPRVTLADVEQNIISTFQFTAEEAIEAMGTLDELTGSAQVPIHPTAQTSLALLSICVLVLKNGFTIIGKSACASPENFDAEVGSRLAYADAVRQIWPLMGYELRERIAASANHGERI